MGPKAGGMRINFRPGRAARRSSASIMERRPRVLLVAVIGQPCAPSRRAAVTIARMPALMASGSLGQASTTTARSGPIGASPAPSAPLSAPLWPPPPSFPVFFGGTSSLVPPTPHSCGDSHSIAASRKSPLFFPHVCGFCDLPPALAAACCFAFFATQLLRILLRLHFVQ